jgi:uncharacterized protein (DUF362 family)
MILIGRRKFLKKLVTLAAISLTGCLNIAKQTREKQVTIKERNKLGRATKSKVYIIKTEGRDSGIRELLRYYDLHNLSGKKVAIKANYNSPDPYPATTHPDTLGAIVDVLKEQDSKIVLAERSGMGGTRNVLETLDVYKLAEEKDIEVVILDELPKEGWIQQEGEHWKRGYLFANVFKEADAVIQTCCLKTHRFGGHFTMSLKNSVGMIAKRVPGGIYNYMFELHASFLNQREKIAEINTSYTPRVVIMDGISGFNTRGPDKGTLIEPGIILAGSDRIALDAAGIAVLRVYGTTKEVEEGKIFEQAQIARAAELGIGATGPDQIEVIPVNKEAQEICTKIEDQLKL